MSDFDKIAHQVKSRRHARALIESPKSVRTIPWWDGINMTWGRADQEAFTRARQAAERSRQAAQQSDAGHPLPESLWS